MSEQPAHFKGKDAINHVAEAQAQGMISAAEIHGLEAPGYLAAGADAMKDTSLLLLLLGVGLYSNFEGDLLAFFVTFAISWLFWRAGRSAWLGWSRLERLHRVLEQEKWEIDHNRSQEKAELKELYRAKGFEGKLLDDVVEVLMADGERLLKVMVEEELGLSLQNVEHPLKQGLGAGLGVLLASSLIYILFNGSFILFLASSLSLIAVSGALIAYLARNKLISAVIWNLALAILAAGFIHYSFLLVI